jgi:hypothetical protein
VTREAWFRVDPAEVKPLPQARIPAPVGRWLDVFERHELACLRALEDPSSANLRLVRETDPMPSGPDRRRFGAYGDAAAAHAAIRT